VRQDSLCRRSYKPAINQPSEDGGREALCYRDQCGAALGRAGQHPKGTSPLSGIIRHARGYAVFGGIVRSHTTRSNVCL
jgi:hypothetical protein